MKCALQQFQHTHPQLTSRITEQPTGQSQPNLDPNGERSFVAMELPKFPLDSEFAVGDMLHERFASGEGPLWRVQLITEATMDRAGLGEWTLPSGPSPMEILHITRDNPQSRQWSDISL